jgi:hypothetical protein
MGQRDCRFGKTSMHPFRFILFFILLNVEMIGSIAQEAPPYREWGPQFNTTGAELKVKEVDRQKLERVTVVSYQFLAAGLPKNKVYRFWMWELGKDPQFGLDATIDNDGTVLTKANPEQHTTPDSITLKVFGVPGEPKRFALLSFDGQAKAFGQVIPFPIESTDGTCRFSVEMLEPLYALVTLRAEGLKPDESFQVTLQSGQEGGRLKPRADQQGHWSSVVAPFVKGKKEGMTQAELTASDCKAKITFPWGVHYFR